AHQHRLDILGVEHDVGREAGLRIFVCAPGADQREEEAGQSKNAHAQHSNAPASSDIKNNRDCALGRNPGIRGGSTLSWADRTYSTCSMLLYVFVPPRLIRTSLPAPPRMLFVPP